MSVMLVCVHACLSLSPASGILSLFLASAVRHQVIIIIRLIRCCIYDLASGRESLSVTATGSAIHTTTTRVREKGEERESR